MSSLKDVAKRANTSTATVSRVINDTGKVSDEMKARVFKAIEELDYKPLQREGKAKETKNVALITPDIENPFFAKVAKTIGKIANTLNYNVLLVNGSDLKDNQDNFLMNLVNTRADGIIYASSYRLEDVIEQAKTNHIPLVVLDREFILSEIDSVSVNNNQAGYIAAEHLIALGHHNIAFIGGTEYTEISKNRHEGYKRALIENDIEYNEAHVAFGNFMMDSGFRAAQKIMEGNPEVTAIVAGNDLMAIGAMNYISQKGLKVPEDISVVGFDDIELASFMTPKLTTVAYPLERMAELAMKSILKQISEEDCQCEGITLFPHLVVRNSTELRCSDEK